MRCCTHSTKTGQPLRPTTKYSIRLQTSLTIWNRINELALMETLLGNLLIGMRIDFVFNQLPNTHHRHRGRDRHRHGDRFAHYYSMEAPICVFRECNERWWLWCALREGEQYSIDLQPRGKCLHSNAHIIYIGFLAYFDVFAGLGRQRGARDATANVLFVIVFCSKS